VGYSAVDDLVQLSLQSSATESEFFQAGDLEVGQRVKVRLVSFGRSADSSILICVHQGAIKRLTEKAVFIQLSNFVDGVVWPIHYSDIKLKHPEKKFKTGSLINARVSVANPVW
jgi:rRNA biogenesis protein RRP5